MNSNKPGNNVKRESFYHSLQWNTVFFCQVNLNLFEQPSFLLPTSFVGVCWLLTLNTWGYASALEKMSS